MDQQLFELFDQSRGQIQKYRGMKSAAIHHKEKLELARAVAAILAMRSGTVSADEVGEALLKGYGIKTLGPAGGSLFKGKQWVWTGNWIASTRVSNHGRMLRVWRLR